MIILGVLALSFGAFHFRTHEQKRVVDLGPVQVDANVEKEHTLPMPPIVGIITLVGGIVLVYVGTKGPKKV